MAVPIEFIKAYFTIFPIKREVLSDLIRLCSYPTYFDFFHKYKNYVSV